MKKRDYYEVLGLNRDADAAAVKKAYRKLAKKYHPDSDAKNAQAEERFKEVTEAYNVLSDEKKRKLYDQFGHAAFEGDGFQYQSGAEGYGAPYGEYREYHFNEDGMDDIFQQFFGGGFQNSGFQGGGFSRDGFGGGPLENLPQGSFGKRGMDINAQVTISFEEAAFGGKKMIHLQDQETGMLQSLEVNIPAGIEDGKTIRLRGKGMAGTPGGEPGDLLLKVQIAKKPGFERKGMDVYTRLFIPFTTAVFGGEVQVQTLYGPVVCRIKEGTRSGTKIRLRGKGIVSMKDASLYGDQYAVVEIQVPQNLNPEAEKKLKEFQRAFEGSGRKSAA